MKFLELLKKIDENGITHYSERVGLNVKGAVKIVEKETGKLIYEDHNLVVNNAKTILTNLIADASTSGSTNEIGKLRAGTGTSPTGMSDTALSNPVIGYLTKSSTSTTSTSATYVFEAGTSLWNGNLLTEFGLYNLAGSTMFSRIVTGGYYKDSSTTLIITWTISFD